MDWDLQALYYKMRDERDRWKEEAELYKGDAAEFQEEARRVRKGWLAAEDTIREQEDVISQLREALRRIADDDFPETPGTATAFRDMARAALSDSPERYGGLTFDQIREGFHSPEGDTHIVYHTTIAGDKVPVVKPGKAPEGDK